MKIRSNAKINLGLSVLRKRNDGFHDIESLFLPISWYDEIEIREDKKLNFSTEGVSIDGGLENNLCLKAYLLMKQQYSIPPVNIHLNKQVPIGAGLGGGSSNAAFTLKALNDLFELKLSEEKLEKLADQLGSDCSFFIQNKPALVTGKGELINTAIDFNLSAHCVVVYPKLHISTQKAYRLVKPKVKPLSIKDAIQLPMEQWQNKVINDFEAPLLECYSELREVKQSLKEMGASFVSMSGSGSSFFAFFAQKPTSKFEGLNYSYKSFDLSF